MSKPQLWVIAGPNGAGKSTLVTRQLEGRMIVVNPDEIAKGIAGGYSFTSQQSLTAGREALKQRREHLKARRTFAVETTLTGKSALQLIDAAKTAGYKVNLIYVGLRDAMASMARVKMRVSRGGHNIAPKDIQRRYPRSLENLGVAAEKVDRLWLIDNSQRRRRLVLSREDQQVRYMSSRLPKWVEQALPQQMRVKSTRSRALRIS